MCCFFIDVPGHVQVVQECGHIHVHIPHPHIIITLAMRVTMHIRRFSKYANTTKLLSLSTPRVVDLVVQFTQSALNVVKICKIYIIVLYW